MMATGTGSGRNWTSENYHRMVDDTLLIADSGTSMPARAFRRKGKSNGAGYKGDTGESINGASKGNNRIDLEASTKLVTGHGAPLENQNGKKPYNAKLEARTH
jgi:hypothetical protein